LKLQADALRRAIAGRLSAAWAERLELKGPVEDDEVAAAFAPIFGAEALTSSLQYAVLVFSPEGSTTPEVVQLRAEEALAHQLIGAWLSEDLAGAISAPVVAGTRLLGIATNSPAYGDVTICDRGDGVFSGSAHLSFGEHVTVTQFFGRPHHQAPIVTATVLNGSSLLHVGLDARRLSAGNETPAHVAAEVAAWRPKLH
jgi:hypothetical protein